jgi:acrylyl-CoA reductase (NADPH)
MKRFKAFRIDSRNGQIRAGFEHLTLDDLTPGEVVIEAVYSGINYKDALAATGKGSILRKFPLVGGIDVAGIVDRSADERFDIGDEVLVCGSELSETRDGGYSEYVRVPGDCVIPLPNGLSLFEVMAIGSAGLAAALAVDKLQINGQSPKLGSMLVTGATGGVGGFAIDLLSGLGYEVIAVSRKQERTAYLESLGAAKVLSRQDLSLGERPLEKSLWGGAVDCVGGKLLSWLTRTVKPMGNIAVIGLTGGVEINTTVMPFILRGISLLGINSVICPKALKARIWERLATDLKPRHIDTIVSAEIPFDRLPDMFEAYIQGRITGRTVVRIAD